MSSPVRYRCTACGNLTRFDVTSTRRTRAYHHFTVGGELTVDHVLPKSRGGKSTWDNLVAACRSCNLRKGDRTPEEAGMRLLRPPKPPRVPLFLLDLKEVPPDWRPFVEGLLG